MRGLFVAAFVILFFLLLGWLSQQRWFRNDVVDDSGTLQTQLPDDGSIGSASTKTVTVNAKLVPKGGLFLSPTEAPDDARAGQLIYNGQTSTLQYYNGVRFVDLVGGVTSIGGLTGTIVVGGGLTVSDGVLSAAAPAAALEPGTYSAGAGLALSGTVFSLAQQGATSGLVLKWNGTGWVPAADNDTTYSAGAGITISSGAITSTLGTSVDLASEVTGVLPVSVGGTGATDAASARANLGAAASGANSDITSLSGLTTALSVPQGGTGATTLMQYGVLYGNGTGAIQATAAGTTGQCLLASNGAAPSWGSCTGSTAFTLAGTSGTGQTISNGDTLTVAAGSNLTTTAGATDTVTVAVVNNPTFTGVLTASGGLSATTGTFSGLITANGGLTVEAGDTFTFNGEAFTDLTGVGLILSGGALQTTLGTSVDLASEVTGVLPVSGGGTGASSLTDLIALGTHTTGTYQLGTTAGDGITITGTAGEGWSPIAAVDSTVCRTSGNCSGVGGTGDILNNGQAGPVTVGTNDATSTVLETNNTARLTIDNTGAATFSGSLTVTSAGTFNGGLTVETGDTFTVNGDGFTDLTGDGLQVASGALGVDATVCRTSGNCVGGGGGGAPNSAAYLTIGNDATLTGERAITAGTNLTASDGGANAAYTLSVVSNPTFTGATTVSGANFQVGDANGDTILFGEAGGGAGRFDIAFQGGAAATQNLAIYGGDAGNGFLMDNFTVNAVNSFFGGNLNVSATTTVSGLITANGGLTVETGDTFTFNGDAFTDLTGTGLTVASNALTVDTAALSSSFVNFSTGAAQIDNTGNADPSIWINRTSGWGDFITFQNDGNNVLSVSSDGYFRLSPVADADDLVNIRNAVTSSVFRIDTFSVGGGGGTININGGSTAGSGGDARLNVSSTSSVNSVAGLRVDNTLSTGNIAEFLNDSGTALTIAASGSATFSGLITANGGLTVEAGDTFSFNGDAFTDFTGDGLQVSSGALTVDATVCRNTGNCAGLGGLQGAYNAGNTILTSDARDIDITLADTTTDSNLDIVIATGSTGAFRIYEGATLGLSYTEANGLNVPGSGTSSQQFGYNAVASGTSSLAVGYGATASGLGGVALGYGATANYFNGSIAIGYNATVNSTGGLVLGNSAFSSAHSQLVIGNGASGGASAEHDIVIGNTASTAASSNGGAIVIGSGASATNGTSHTGAIVIGRAATVGSSNGIALGYQANVAHSNSIVIGQAAASTSSGQFVLGSDSFAINNLFIGEGVTSATPTNASINATGGLGTDIQGGNLTLAGGRGTGLGAGGNIVLQTAPAAGATGSTLNALQTRLTIESGGNIVVGVADTTGSLLVLDTKTGAGDPAGVNGGMYYNSNTGKFRCFENGAWKDCGGLFTDAGSYSYVTDTTDDVVIGASTSSGAKVDIVDEGADGWTSQIAADTTTTWNSVTHGNGLFVAVGQGGSNQVMTSPDGITWTAQTAAANNQWSEVTYGNGLFVAVSRGGTDRVMTSPDGITWTARTAAAQHTWSSVTYGNGLFVATACGVSSTNACNGTAGDRVMTSPDGITWTLRVDVADNLWGKVTYGNGLFVATACGVAGTQCNSTAGDRVMTSPDGITWTARTATGDYEWGEVAFGNGLFVVIGHSGPDRVMTSPDGITWTARTAATSNVYWISVTYGGGFFVAVACGTGSSSCNNNATNRVMTSPDGINWTAQADAEDDQWRSVTYGNGTFVAVSQGNGSNRVMISQNNIGLRVIGNTSLQGQLWVTESLSVGSDINTGGLITYTAGTADTNTAVCQNSAGQLAGCTSSARFKSDVAAGSYGLDELRQLQAVSYTWTASRRQDYGFIAEEVAGIIPQAVTYDANGEVSSFNPATITALLVASVQELDTQFQAVMSGNLPELHVSGEATFGSNVTFNGHVLSGGDAPTIAPESGTAEVDGNDTAGRITFTAGLDSVAGKQVTVTFSDSYERDPVVSLTPAAEASVKAGAYVESAAEGFVIHFAEPPVPGRTYRFNYFVIQ